MVQVGVSTTEKQPRLPWGRPIPVLVASVFQKPQERSDASPGTNHDDGNGGVFGEMKFIHPPGDQGNLGKFVAPRNKFFHEGVKISRGEALSVFLVG